MGTIVAIGGGEIIPTASSDSLAYVDTFNKVYGEKLGCNTDSLLLLSNNLEDKEVEDKILSSELIYVGGGNTEKMIKIWKEM